MDCPPRYSTPRSPERRTLGGAAANVAKQLGIPLMPWQRQVLDVALEIAPSTGRLVYREVICGTPRQSGKTTLLLTLMLTRALMAPQQQIRYTAQTGADARKKLIDDWTPLLDSSRFSELYRKRMTNGHEALRFRNGSHVGLVATTAKSGHGGTIDLAILDEAFAHPDARLEQAMKPAMITRPQPQLWIVSTAGTMTASPYLLGKVQGGREIAEAALTHSVAYFEWSADEDLDPADPATWWSCMPALGHTVTEEAVASDFASMERHEFERAYLNRWTTALSDPVIALEDWIALADQSSVLQDPVTLAVDVSPDRSRASIGAAGKRSDGLWHLEVVEAKQGTSWVVQRLSEIVRSHRVNAVIYDPGSPAGSLSAQMAELSAELVPVSARQLADACGLLYDGVTEQALRHLGTSELVSALDGAAKRPLGDAWAWSRKSSAIDISPLVACTLAYWGARAREQKAGAGVWDLNDIVANIRAKQARALAA
jgi:phage terminase large subunit-like protein